ncbi:MAG: hypothetical protein V3S04_02290 [Candidatus Omnitrophota bacterium]
MFYILVFSGLAFFVFGVASTLYNSLKIQREYELITTELVRTDSSLHDLEVKYVESQSELKMFKVNIEASSGWTKEGISGTHGELEKMKTEYIRVKLRTEKEKPFDVLKVQEKCNKLIKESEEYNKLLTERNGELSKLKDIFDDIRKQLEVNQLALSATQEELKGLKAPAETQKRLKNVVEELEVLKENRKALKDTKKDGGETIIDAITPSQQDEKKPSPPHDNKDNDIYDDASRRHLETMRSFLHSLDDKPVEDYKLENNDIPNGE